MKRPFGTLLCFLACFCMIGGHWGVLQGIAWAGMLRDYSERYGLKEAANLTFSGEKPCDLCKTVADGRAAEKGQKSPAERSLKAEKPIDALIAETSSTIPVSSVVDVDWPLVNPLYNSVGRAPLSPPPRSA